MPCMVLTTTVMARTFMYMTMITFIVAEITFMSITTMEVRNIMNIMAMLVGLMAAVGLTTVVEDLMTVAGSMGEVLMMVEALIEFYKRHKIQRGI